MMLNPISWCLWATAALAVAFIGRNPYVQVMLAMVVLNVWLPYRRGHSLGALKFGLLLALTPVLFSVVLSRFGRHVLVTLPPIPIVGGRWTWEALAFGATTGMALLVTISVFGVLQATVRSADLVALLPRPLYRAGTVFALSLAFAPKTIASFQSIREARQVRGQRTGWRSVPAMLVPLLLTTLEQALQYGESLDARGYGSQRRTRYRPILWSAADLIVIGASIVALSLTLLRLPTPYNAYVDLIPPAPSSISIVAVLLLAAPAVLAAFPRGHHVADHA